jgi:hypothetical protein
MNRALWTAEANRFGWQVGQTPGGSTIKQRIEHERAAGHGPLNAMPSPAQMRDIRQGGAGEASPMLNEWAGAQGDEHNANQVCGANGQTAKQVVDSMGHQINWRGSQVKW